MEVISYDKESRDKYSNFEKLVASLKDQTPWVSWVNFILEEDDANIKELFHVIALPRLIQLNIREANLRTRAEEFDKFLLLSLRMPFEEQGDENIHFVVGKNLLLTFQQLKGDPFDAIRERIHNGGGVVRERGADYLLYLLLDAILLSYEKRLEDESDKVRALDSLLVNHPPKNFSNMVEDAKTRLFQTRKDLHPIKEALVTLANSDFAVITKSTKSYYRKLQASVADINDEVEYFRQQLDGLSNTYLASLSNRMNEVMKVLAIVSTLFIPITFIAGIYGMNMAIPGMENTNAFWYVAGSMVASVCVMLGIFIWKKWL